MNSIVETISSLVPAAYAAAGSITVDQPAGFKITDIGKLVTSGISVALILAGVLVFAFLVFGGIEWITSGGDKTKTEAAKNRITAALVGLAIVAASWALMKLISYFFGIDDFFSGSVSLPKPYN
jgi:amino acid transporter